MIDEDEVEALEATTQPITEDNDIQSKDISKPSGTRLASGHAHLGLKPLRADHVIYQSGAVVLNLQQNKPEPSETSLPTSTEAETSQQSGPEDPEFRKTWLAVGSR